MIEKSAQPSGSERAHAGSGAVHRPRRAVEFGRFDLGESARGRNWLRARRITKKITRNGRGVRRGQCAALSETLIESELFGHVKGSFTGGASDRAGRFEWRTRARFFWMRIGELTNECQTKLCAC